MPKPLPFHCYNVDTGPAIPTKVKEPAFPCNEAAASLYALLFNLSAYSRDIV